MNRGVYERPFFGPAVIVLALLASVLVSTPSATAQTSGSRVDLVDLDGISDPAEIAVALSQATTFPDPVSEVLIARDNDFADALASGGLQDSRPLLLVPDTGGLPEIVEREVRRLSPERVVILGGDAAVPEGVEDDLADMGLQIERVSGAERIATAVEVANRMPRSTTALVARALRLARRPDQWLRRCAGLWCTGG